MHTKISFRTISGGAYRILNLLAVVAMVLAAPLNVYAFTDTDKEDYTPGSVVTIFGDNSDGALYLPGETVVVSVIQPVLPDPLTCEAVVSETGAWSCQLQLSIDPALAVGYYEYTTLGLTSGFTETHFFTDAAPPAVKEFEQCDPPMIFDYSTYTCVSSPPTGWVNGNNDGFYAEGETIPYRLHD